MSDKDNSPTSGSAGAGGAANPSVKAGAAATPSSATAGNASGGTTASTRPYTDPYAASVTGANTSGMRHEAHSARDRAESAAHDARERARRAYEQGEHAYEDSVRWARDRYERGAEWASDTYDDAARFSRKNYRKVRNSAGEFIEENPLMIGALGLAAGLVIGALLPISRRENEYLGPWRDDLRDRGYRYGHDAMQRARHIAEEGYRAGFEEARRRGMTPSQMAESARDVGRATREGASSTASEEFGEDPGARNNDSSPVGSR